MPRCRCQADNLTERVNLLWFVAINAVVGGIRTGIAKRVGNWLYSESDVWNVDLESLAWFLQFASALVLMHCLAYLHLTSSFVKFIEMACALTMFNLSSVDNFFVQNVKNIAVHLH